MNRQKMILTIAVSFVVAGLVISNWRASQADTPDTITERIERAFGDEYEKQMVSKLAGTIIYADDAGNEIKYHIIKTTYNKADPSEVTGLNDSALFALLDPNCANTCQEMSIQERPAALYVLEDRSYLCWTYSPEVSYIIEYDHSVVSDDDIIKMAESAKPWNNE